MIHCYLRTQELYYYSSTVVQFVVQKKWSFAPVECREHMGYK